MGFLSAWNGRRVLVTGGTGFVGQHVLQRGLDAGIEMHNLSRSGNLPPRVSHHRASLCDRDGVFAVLREVRPDGIIHLAAAGVSDGSSEMRQLLESNAVGTDNLLAAAAAAGTRPRVVLAGSGFEYAPQARPITEEDSVEPFTPYGVSKAAAALCARLYAGELPITLLRLFSIYGPGERPPRLIPSIIEAARRGEAVALTACEQIRDYTYVGDVAEALWRVLSLPGRAASLQLLNVGSGTAVPLRHVVISLATILSDRGLEPRLRFGARPYRPGEPITYAADVSRMRETLGWAPSISLEEGLTRTVDAVCCRALHESRIRVT